MSIKRINTRAKGHRYEREVARRLRDRGFPHAVTSRSESKSMDDLGVDIMNNKPFMNGNLPFNLQLKSYATRVKYDEILDAMPTEFGHNIILHKYTPKAGERFITKGEYAICKADFMLELLELKYGLSDEQI